TLYILVIESVDRAKNRNRLFLCKNNLSNADIAPLTVEIGRLTSLLGAGVGFTSFFRVFTERDGLFTD
ncbi:MAG: hypothetical protein LUH01_02570, partial [Parabacteroides gordonii]|nr:hypothetical protein [Parabacteroides gordonii]